MKYYFAGSDGRTMIELLSDCGVQHFLSAFGGKKDKKLDEYPYQPLIDSGGYSVRVSGKTIEVEDYIHWLNENKVKLAFNLDTNDVQETLINQTRLEKETDTYIIPIYHMSDYLDKEHVNLIEQYLDYPYIGLGGTAGTGYKGTMEAFLDYVFRRTKDKVRVHGLGTTSNKLLKKYPFYSVDSTSWLSFSKYGQSAYNSEDMSFVKIRSKHWKKLCQEEVKGILKDIKDIQKLWEVRNIKWEDFNG